MSLLLPTSTAFLRLQAARCRDAGGLVHRQHRHPYGSLADAAENAASWLAARGLGRGDHVAIVAANTPALLVWKYAIWAIGAVAVPVGTRTTADEGTALLDHARARYVVADSYGATLARGLAASAGVGAAILGDDTPITRPKVLRRAGAAGTAKPHGPEADRLAILAYTSGTTGRPKGVMLTHANLLWSALACSTARGDAADGVGVCLSPLTHTPVFVSHLLCRLLSGQTAVLLEKFDLETVLESAERHGITDLPLIAGMVFSLVERGRVPQRVRKLVRKVSVGGAATPMDAKRKLAEIFPAADVFEAYGQTESTDGVTMARHGSVFRKPGTIGRANPYVCVDVLRPDGTFAEPGEPGEIGIAGPTVMRGYYRDRVATNAAVRDGWLRTGDLGHRDADGDFFITGRAKDLIITGGENVSPIEVEEILRRCPGVTDVAVLGTPHARWGEQVTAVIVKAPDRDVTAESVASFAGRYLAGYKKPRRVEFVAALPRNAANKVQTAVLREQLTGKA